MHYRGMERASPLRRYWTLNLLGLAVWAGAGVAAFGPWPQPFPGYVIFGLIVLGVIVQAIAVWFGKCLVCGTPMSHSFNGLLFWWPNDYCGRCGSSMKRTSTRSHPSA